MRKYRFLSALLAVTLIIHTLPVGQVFAAPETEAEVEETDDTDLENDADSDTMETESIDINTVEDFLAFAENCHLDSWSVNKIINLKQDIDLTGTSFETIPVFAGVFDGGGHTISGFRPTDQSYIVGLFRYIQKDGIVSNLTVTGRIDAINEKECIGSICGINRGTIKNCQFHGIVSGQNTVGGIAGINEDSGNITRCTANGRIMGYYSTGGIVGFNHGIITFCNNRSGINDNSTWVEEDDEMGTGLFFSIQTSGDEVELYSGVDTGGIAGYSDGLIERCTNYGTVGYEHTGYNIGGIVGRQAGIVLLCTNNGEVYGRKDVGGIIGQMEPDIEVDEAQSLRNAVNKLHDLIAKTLDDMQDGKNTIKTDLDALSMYGDGALTSGDALAGQMSDFVDDNVEQIQSVTERIEHIIDLLPDIMDNIDASGDAFTRLTDIVNQLVKDLNFLDAVDNSAYNETDYSRVSLLSTVGGRLLINTLNPAKGDTVTITAVYDEGYTLDGSLSVVDANGTSVSYTETTDENSSGSRQYTFTMPSANVKVTAYFRYKDADSTFRAYVAESDIVPEGNSTSDQETNEEEQSDSESGENNSFDSGTEGDADSDSQADENAGSDSDTGEDPDSDSQTGKDPDSDLQTDEDTESKPDSDKKAGDDADNNSSNDTGTNADDRTEPSADGTGKQIRLHSNLSGNASYTVNENTVTLTVNPDSGYTLSTAPAVKDAGGSNLSVTKSRADSYHYEFDIASAASPITVEITFKKQNKQAAVDTALDDLEAAIQNLQEDADYINACQERINAIMIDENGNMREWSDLSSAEQEQVIDEITNMTNCLSRMSSSAASILSALSTLYNILTPYIQDAMEAARKDIDKAIDEIHNMISSLREASRNVRGIVNYMNAQPDIQFATLGSEFDAGREDLHNQLMGISDSLKSLSNNASAYSDIVNEDLQAVNDQLNVVFNLLADHLTDSAGLSVEELYEEVAEEDIDSIITGRCDSCINNGIVKGDINIGGIAGAMSIDEEDPEDNAAGSIDYQVGRRFITKCIIDESINKGYVTAKKDGAGGIVGYMKHGIVTNCEGYGNIESTEGNYVGGIAGESLTIIKNCYSLCSVSGGKNIGGIAGYANTVQECYAIVSADASIGKSGAIAGQITSDADAAVIDNYYVGDDIFGIDNISYAGIAEPIPYTELLTVEHLPTAFWHLTITYRIEDTYLGTQEVKYGESLANLDYPEIPVKEGYYGVWPDYSDRVMTGNLLIEGTYVDTVTVVESSEKAPVTGESWQKPYALVEQIFTEDTILNATLSDRTPPTEAANKEYVIYDISLENGNIGNTETFAIRLLNPYGDNVNVWGYLNGDWQELTGKTRGQYLQVEMTGPKEAFCIVDNKSNTILIVVTVIAGAVVLLLIVFFLKRVKSKAAGRKAKKQEPED